MRPTSSCRYALVFSAAVLVSFGCAKTDDNAEYTNADTTTTSAAPAPAPAAAAPTDAQIAHIAVTANTIDVDAGKAAQSKAQSADVKNFAKTMVTDHTAANDKASALAKKLSLTPEDNPTSQQLNSDAQSFTQQLSSKTGKDYDKSYIDHEATFHQQVLDALDNTLVPNAQNAELKALLTQVRATVAAHLQMAQDLQKKLGS
ncbi:MAG TPA: DUF4142 domain-containing protein [Longimicrobiales bacterium]